MNTLTKFWAKLTKSDKYLASPRRAFWARGGVVVNEDSAMQVAAFHRGSLYIATQVAKLPWYVKEKNNTIVEDGNIPYILNIAPNPEITAMSWRLYTILAAIIHGNGYAEIERSKTGIPLAMWPMDSRRTFVVRDPDTGQLLYKYINQTGGEVFLEPRNVFHLKSPHLKDPFQGQSIAGYAREVLGIGIASDQMASGIFFNGGIPSGVLRHKGRLSDEAYKRLKDTWDADQTGKGSGNTRILEEDTTYEQIKVDPETLQFLGSRKFTVLEICRFLGVPPSKVYDTDAATYSNVENANLEVTTETLDYWCRALESEANVKLLTYNYAGKYTDIDLYDIARGDMKTRSEYFKAMMGIGAMSPNEIREKEGMAPYAKGGRMYISTNNFTPVDRMDEVIDANIKQKEKSAQPPKQPTQPNPDKTKAEIDLLEITAQYLSK